jgi:microcompartment protein CcmL/EutN
VNEALGILETYGLTPTLVALDAMEKSGAIRVLQCELNDACGVATKIVGDVSTVHAAIEAGRRVAATMGGRPVASVIPRPDADAMHVILSANEFNPLIQQGVVFTPEDDAAVSESIQSSDNSSPRVRKEETVSQSVSFALGLIETQGFTAVFEAIDTACKAANVEVIGKEKLGGGYVTVIVRGELSAVTAAVEAGKTKVEGLGVLIAAHVIARPSPNVLALLPKA